MPLDHYVFVRVEHVHINDGGQAAIGNVITPGSNR